MNNGFYENNNLYVENLDSVPRDVASLMKHTDCNCVIEYDATGHIKSKMVRDPNDGTWSSLKEDEIKKLNDEKFGHNKYHLIELDDVMPNLRGSKHKSDEELLAEAEELLARLRESLDNDAEDPDDIDGGDYE